MSAQMRKLQLLLAVVIVLSMILTACAAPATPAPAAKAAPTTAPAAAAPAATKAPEPTKAPAAEPTKAPAAAAPAATKAPEPTKAAAAAAPAGGFSVPNMEAYANAKREETLILDNPYRFETAQNWNPYTPNNSGGWGMSIIGRDPLVLLSYGTGKIENWMAESITPNADSTQWSLKLRPGITWNDGTPFTVDDIIYSIELQMKTEKLGNWAVYREWIKNVEKVDALNMKFNLNKPNPRFALERFADNLCGYDYIVPKHIWEKVQDPLTFTNIDIKAGLPLSTGPYVLYKMTPNEAIWVRNDNWWAAKTGLKKLPQPKKIIYSFAGTEEVRVATGADNGFDGLQDITLSSYEALKAKNKNWNAFQKAMPLVWADPCARTLSINNGAKPWDDKDMRWVLNYVMDRKQIIDVAYEGTTIPGAFFWPLYPSMQKYTDLIPKETLAKFEKPDLTKAAEILTAKGYKKGAKYWAKDGKDLGLEIQTHEAFSELERVADVYVEQLQKFGINAVKQKLTGATWGDNNALGKYEAQSGWQSCGSIMEPYNTLRTLIGTDGVAKIGERPQGRQNIFRYNNAKYNELTDKIGAMQLDDPKLPDMAKEAFAILYDELPVIPTAQSRKLIPWNETYWTNWPNKENYYQRPVLWCPSFVGVLPEIQQVKK